MCAQNGGMTHPIRLVSFLLAQEHNASYVALAEQALNGTMYGCCYGPYNLRNEIDRHNTTVGGHNSNTHFVTGDGGFVNSFVSGFGGLMLGASQSALRLSKPTVPERTKGLRFKGLAYLGGSIDYEFTSDQIVFTVVKEPPQGSLCVAEAGGAVHKLKGAGQPTALPTSGFGFPTDVGLCSAVRNQ